MWGSSRVGYQGLGGNDRHQAREQRVSGVVSPDTQMVGNEEAHNTVGFEPETLLVGSSCSREHKGVLKVTIGRSIPCGAHKFLVEREGYRTTIISI